MRTSTKSQRRPSHVSAALQTCHRRGERRRSERGAVKTRPDSHSATATIANEQERRLEEVVLTTWAALRSGHPIECPVCGGALTTQSGCRSCGSRLS